MSTHQNDVFYEHQHEMKLEKTLKVGSWLPMFNGFYGSIWESDNEEMEIEYINEKREKIGLKPLENDDSIDWDYDGYHQEIVQKITQMIGDNLIDLGMIQGYGLGALSSPREYNFTNDSIQVDFTLNQDHVTAIRNYLVKYQVEFNIYLKDHYTSYDGFCSSYSNDLDEWILDVKATVSHEHKLGSVLQFILENEHKKSGSVTPLDDAYREDMPDYPYVQAKNFEALTTKEATK